MITRVVLVVLCATGCAHTQSAQAKNSTPAAIPASGPEMPFSDQPNFSVAGVTDWTAVGGHGSDSTLRTTESLASATAALHDSGKPAANAAPSVSPAQVGQADTYRLSGERFERAGDALSAVRAFEQAASLDPSEPNYFAWGSELLVHRAVWQAVDVFRKGTAAFPASVRMQTALGTALFAGARYDEAAEHVCAASDLDPHDAGPYLFMGKMQIAAPDVLPCIAPHLSRFVTQQPANLDANYLYAMVLLKGQKHTADPASMQHAESLLKRAVSLDPHCGDAYLQLGNLTADRHDTQQAIRYYMAAAQATPELADAHYRLGVLYARSGEHDKAKHEFHLHDQIAQQQAALAEQQRHDIQQFLFAKP